MWFENILEAIGNTPMVRLKKCVADRRPIILAKLEFMIPVGA
jgi:cysteine synthase